MTLDALPPIPDQIRCFPFWRPFGGMVVDGVKSLETRTWSWPHEPAWIAVYATKRFCRLDPDALLHLRVVARPQDIQRWNDEPDDVGRVIGLAYVTGSRLLVREDLPRSFFFEPNRHAWELTHAKRLAHSLGLDDLGLKAPPQSFVWVPGAPFRAALEAQESAS